MPLGLAGVSGAPVIQSQSKINVEGSTGSIRASFLQMPMIQSAIPAPGIIVLAIHECVIDGDENQVFPGGDARSTPNPDRRVHEFSFESPFK